MVNDIINKIIKLPFNYLSLINNYNYCTLIRQNQETARVKN